MISYAGIPECISLIYIVFKFSLLGREENLNICRFNEPFTLNYTRKIAGGIQGMSKSDERLDIIMIQKF
jgi:hypothetical protein